MRDYELLVGVVLVRFGKEGNKPFERILSALYLFYSAVLTVDVGNYYGLDLQKSAEHGAGGAYATRAFEIRKAFHRAKLVHSLLVLLYVLGSFGESFTLGAEF